MGASFANVHVRPRAAADPLAEVRSLLDTHLRAQGFVPADAEGDRGVVLVSGEGWISVHDEASDRDPERHGPLLLALSRDVGLAIGVAVIDSDVLLLDLARDGNYLDRFNSNPSYPEEGRRPAAKPHARAWAKAFALAEKELLPVFASDEAFAEAALRPLAALLGLSLDRLSAGYEDLRELPAGAVRLHYRFAARPDAVEHRTGPPRLLTAAQELAIAQPAMTWPAPRRIEIAVGAEVQLGLTARNHGGEGRGLLVKVEAPSWIQPRTAQLVLGNPREPRLESAELAGEGRVSVSFPDLVLPPGVAEPDPRSLAALGPKRAMAPRHASQVHLNVRCLGLAAGEGSVTLSLVPAGHPGGLATALIPVAVRDTTDRPLRAPATIQPAQLAPLAARDHLVALAVMDDVAALAGIAGALQEVVPGSGSVRTTAFPRGSSPLDVKAPRLRKVKARDFLGASWRTLAATVPEQSTTVHVDWLADGEGNAALEIGVGLLGWPGAVPALAISLPASDRAEQALVAAIDRMGPGLIQALVTRWGAPVGIEATPYEVACGVRGQCVLDRAWVERWLRGLGVGTLWLGTAIRAHVPGSPARWAISDVREAERALAPILPGGEDWRAGVAAHLRRGRGGKP